MYLVLSSIFRWCLLIAASINSFAAYAQMDCAPLDPRAAIERRHAAEISASVDTALKIAKASGTIKGEAETKILAIPQASNATEQTLLQLRSVYVFCGMIANARDLNTERKFALYKELLSLHIPPFSLVGNWQGEERPNCPYRLNFNGSGELAVQSGQEQLRGTYSISNLSGPRPIARVERVISYSNGQPDCDGKVNVYGQNPQTAFIFLEEKDLIRLCFDTGGVRCFATLRRK